MSKPSVETDAVPGPPEPPSPAQPAPATAPEPPPTIDLATLAKERDDARRELGTARSELEKFQKAAKEREDAEKSELQKAQERAAELEAERADLLRQAQEARLRTGTISNAARLGFADPEDAIALLDLAAVEHGKDGAPSNLPKLLADLLKAKPYLAAAPPGGQGVRSQSSASDEADAALKAGDWRTSMSLKNRQLMERPRPS